MNVTSAPRPVVISTEVEKSHAPKDPTLLSSGAFSATPFLRKGAKYCGGAATFPPSESEHNLSTQPFYTTFLHNRVRSGRSNLRGLARPFLFYRVGANTTGGPIGPAPLAAAPHSPPFSPTKKAHRITDGLFLTV